MSCALYFGEIIFHILCVLALPLSYQRKEKAQRIKKKYLLQPLLESGHFGKSHLLVYFLLHTFMLHLQRQTHDLTQMVTSGYPQTHQLVFSYDPQLSNNLPSDTQGYH